MSELISAQLRSIQQLVKDRGRETGKEDPAAGELYLFGNKLTCI